MTLTLNTLKNSSHSTERLLNALNTSSPKKFKKDERFWELPVDKAGNGFATIRFLDSPYVDGEDGVPFVQFFTHGFKGPTGQWYIERSLTSIGLQDPVSEYNSKLWATGLESNKNIARAQKRQLVFVSNILVISDPVNRENEGKVFLFRYGKEIFDKIQERQPELKKADQVYDPDFLFFNPYNMFTGANFKLKSRKKDSGFRTYDKSEFVAPTPLSKSEPEIEKVWKAAYSLKEVADASNYKPYADLKARLDVVLGIETSSQASTAESSVAAEVDAAVGNGAATIDDAEYDVFKRLADE
jgi:hypothetical protein